jgi:hypothetical protein
MYPYTDPTGTGLLESEGALDPFRSEVHGEYRACARERGSAFTLLDAFDSQARRDTVTWLAFPRKATATHEEIEAERFTYQDEYVEWRTERDTSGRVTRVTFTTEFPEYYMAFAVAGLDSLMRAIRAVSPDANPTPEELFGPDAKTTSPAARARAFQEHRRLNPWVNGQKEILCLGHRSNTLSALFGLVGPAASPRSDVPPQDLCGDLGDACVPGRNSDPTVCAAVQQIARSGAVLTLADPAGIRILKLGGNWHVNGRSIDINDAANNGGVWNITRNGRRAVLNVTAGLTLDDEPIESGTQVATKLTVGATVISAPADAVPAWARTGQESTRLIV